MVSEAGGGALKGPTGCLDAHVRTDRHAQVAVGRSRIDAAQPAAVDGCERAEEFYGERLSRHRRHIAHRAKETQRRAPDGQLIGSVIDVDADPDKHGAVREALGEDAADLERPRARLRDDVVGPLQAQIKAGLRPDRTHGSDARDER